MLLNSMLNNVSIYYFSFYKDPKVVIHVIEKSQRAFLWGRVEGKMRIN